MVLDGPGDVVDDGEVLLAAGLDGRQHRFDKLASLFALSTETQLSPDDSMTQAAFGRVVCRLNTLHLHKCPQPCFRVRLLRGRFVAVQRRLRWQCGREFIICGTQRRRGAVLMLDCQRRTAGNFQNRFDKQRCSAFVLPETGHEQSNEGDQFRSGHPNRHARRQRSTGGFTATRTAQPMALLLSDDRFDLGHLPDLMPQRAFIIAREDRTSPATLFRFERNDFVAFLGGNQRLFVSGMSGQSTPFSLRFSRVDAGRACGC